ncbi:zinc finger CCCH domain-containing protein 20-like [Andrographis paniculata]|uniref:zinc finger CCCH domain-containing protein 20-like n=1 Tax=Andrographis paniculata TaxID=175694 RepID=UPI0021E6FED9|nr:zinc finger CCCH domain-containing protein 20-like [Andrographis paniculata]
MMIGERSSGGTPPWEYDGANGDDYSFLLQSDCLKALQRFLPSNSSDAAPEFRFPEADLNGEVFPVDAHSSDHFRMFEFKVRKCTRGRSHDWTECPYAHPGEKARRRDPRKYHYSGTACSDFRKCGGCRKGDACEHAHGVFECWLHPARYRTQPCKDGMSCRRRVCFFAHSPDQLRLLTPRADSFDASPHRLVFMPSPPESISPPPADSPPLSPMTSGSVNEIVASIRRLHLNKFNSVPPSWISGGASSPRLNPTRPGYFSLPTTPTRSVTRPGFGWERSQQDEAPMAFVESGRDLRAKMFEKLSKENPLDRSDPDLDPSPNPYADVGWVSELLK